jgi:hypothetical protein
MLANMRIVAVHGQNTARGGADNTQLRETIWLISKLSNKLSVEDGIMCCHGQTAPWLCKISRRSTNVLLDVSNAPP